ncbi:MAG: DNA primase [Candidatus Kapabacteria bacterium]|jgi:DNA primase|nr:DNA primase [Candidatus Kapabacteria bacterium]
MKIPDDLKRQIVEQTDLVELVEEVVDLKQRGGNYLGLCPFHNEKTPSFNVMRDRGFYKCFGCGTSGDSIKFMMEYHGLSFVEALKELAKRAGILLPEDNLSDEQISQMNRKDVAFKVLKTAANYYHQSLHERYGKIAAVYFRNRNFSTELIEQFSLGYSPDSWDATQNALRKEGFPDSGMLDAGLIGRSQKSGSLYDRFRGRVMFPIQDNLGRIIGFGGRTLQDDKKEAKYINSPQSNLYDKSKTLYGLFQAKSAIRSKKAVILTEGYADVLTLHQADFKNTVASSGTSLTKEQLANMYRYCKKLYIVYDADEAGLKAAERALQMALEYGFEVNVVKLPVGEDPDSLVREHGADIFKTYLRDAPPFLPFMIDRYKTSGALDSPSGKADAIRELVKIISSIPDRLQHDEYMSRMATLMSLSESQIRNVYHEKSNQERKSEYDKKYKSLKPELKANKPDIQTENNNGGRKINKELNASQRGSYQDELSAEEYLLINLAVSQSDALKLLIDTYSINSDFFISQQGKHLFSIIQKVAKDEPDILSSLFRHEEISDADKNILTGIATGNHYSKAAFTGEELSDNWSKYISEMPEKNVAAIVKDAVNSQELVSVKKAIATIQNTLKSAEVSEQIALLNEFKALRGREIEIQKILSKESTDY